jgi:hypothetical protein
MKGLVEASPQATLPRPSDLLSERIVGKHEVMIKSRHRQGDR